jgi:hypothetical protein
MIVKGNNTGREITTKTKRTPTPVSRKDTVKRRRDKERLFVMIKFANLRENKDNGKR